MHTYLNTTVNVHLILLKLACAILEEASLAIMLIDIVFSKICGIQYLLTYTGERGIDTEAICLQVAIAVKSVGSIIKHVSMHSSCICIFCSYIQYLRRVGVLDYVITNWFKMVFQEIPLGMHLD